MENYRNIEQIPPAQIEARSFAIIGEELARMGIHIKPEEEAVVKRVIHATADFDYATALKFSPGAIEAGLKALKQGAMVVTDTNMAKAGINKQKLGSFGGEAVCFMADEDVAAGAKERGCTRAALSMEKAARQLGRGISPDMEGGLCRPEAGQEAGAQAGRPVIVAVGNAPTALITLDRLIREGRFLPDLLIGAPVGFVNVAQAKELILGQDKVPWIVARGRKGGSGVAAAIMNALLGQI